MFVLFSFAVVSGRGLCRLECSKGIFETGFVILFEDLHGNLVDVLIFFISHLIRENSCTQSIEKPSWFGRCLREDFEADVLFLLSVERDKFGVHTIRIEYLE